MDGAIGAVVVGTSFGVLTHVRALKDAGFAVRALVGRDAAKAAERAERFDAGLGTDDLAAALALPGVEVVAVSTPPHTHAAIALQAIEAGKHVVCEKPFTADAGEGVELLEAAERAGIVHLLGTEWRFATGQAQLSRAVRSGAIGTPLLGVFELHIPTHVDPAAELPDWWQLESEGGGWMGAHGSHLIDQVRSTMGEIVGVSASLQRLAARPAMTADDTYTVMMRLDNGATVLLHSSCAIAGPFVMVTKITGDRGTAWLEGDELWIDDGSGAKAMPLPDDLPVVAPVPPPGDLLQTAYDGLHSMGIDLEPYTRLYTRLRDQLRGLDVPDDPVAATFADGLACQRVLDAIRHSSHNDGAWTPVPVA